MLPLVTDLNENLSAHKANHSEQNGSNLSKIRSVVLKTEEFENWMFL